MTQSGLDNFGVYQHALALFDLVVEDMRLLQKEPLCYRLCSQQIASADSICANIEEGYGRLSRNEYIRFLDIARGSARETQGRYGRLRHWLGEQIVSDRIHRAGTIVGGLTNTIISLRADRKQNAHPSERVKEASEDYGSEEDWRMSPIGGKESADEASPNTRPPPPDTL